MWLSLLLSRAGERYRQNETFYQSPAKTTAAEAEGILIQIGLKMFLGQTMILSPNISIGNEGMAEESGNIMLIALKSAHIRVGFVTNIRNVFWQITGMDR